MARKLDPQLTSLPSPDHYLDQLDVNKIETAILSAYTDRGPMAEYDFDDAKQMLLAAVDRWLVQDIHDLQLTGIEKEYQETILVSDQPATFRGIMDLTGICRGRLNATEKHKDTPVVIDWKTTQSHLDTNWKNRHEDSWQWKKYAHFAGAKLVIFRGISRYDVESLGGRKTKETREIVIEVPEYNQEDLDLQLLGLVAQRRALISSGLDIWPRRIPGACGAYGRECPYFEDCRTLSIPRKTTFPADKTFSYSSMDKFMNCAERYRRGVVEDNNEDTDESLFGTAIHAGLAELYSQINERFHINHG